MRLPLDRFFELFESMRDRIKQEDYKSGCLLGVLSQEVGADDGTDMLKQFLTDGFAGWHKIWSDALERAKRAGELREGAEPDIVARVLLDGFEGAVIRAKLDRNSASIDEFIAFARLAISK